MGNEGGTPVITIDFTEMNLKRDDFDFDENYFIRFTTVGGKEISVNANDIVKTFIYSPEDVLDVDGDNVNDEVENTEKNEEIDEEINDPTKSSFIASLFQRGK